MKQLITLLHLILMSCNINNTNTIETTKQYPDEIDAIKRMLTSQQRCWNNGDIDGFMQGYWKSEKLVFTSLNHNPTYGWENTLERYKNSYPTKASMGTLNFEILDLKITSQTAAILRGKWKLIREKESPNGLFWLDLEKLDNNWLITKDSTIISESNKQH